MPIEGQEMIGCGSSRERRIPPRRDNQADFWQFIR
jgi:hypothetical protein